MKVDVDVGVGEGKYEYKVRGDLRTNYFKYYLVVTCHLPILHLIMEQISVKQYADMIGKSRQWILFLIINNKPLPLPVKRVEKVGKAYVITLN